MTEEELQGLLKATRRARRIATERAGALHDLVEDRLPQAYQELPAMAQATYQACQAWAEAEAAYADAQAAMN